MTHKTIFISYSWDNEDHKEWVLNLANGLVTNGIDVLLDQYDLSAGNEMTYFMEKAMTADKVVIILTPNYKLKADNREGGVGYEYSLLTKEFYEKAPDISEIIPVLRNGDKNSSCPTFVKTRLFHDMREDSKFDSKFYELIKLLIDKPLVQKPSLGKLPNFDDATIPELEKAIVDFKNKEAFSQKKYSIINSEEGTRIFVSTTNQILQKIKNAFDKYEKNFGLHCHVKTSHEPSILLSTVNFTFFFSVRDIYSNSASDAKVILNFFEGPVGLDPSIDYQGKTEVIYKTVYNFNLDENLAPIFIKSDNSNIKLTANEIAAIAVREVITNEIKFRESRLR
jgi:hypothetical protein